MSDYKPENLVTTVRRKSGKVHIKIEYDVEEDKWMGKNEMKARLERTLPWLAPHLHTWADFDQGYSIDLFCDSLTALGKGLLRWSNHLNAEHCGHRALAAARMLHDAYHYETWEDKSYQNWSSRNVHGWKPYKKGLTQMTTTHLYNNAMGMDREEYSSKMWHLIFDRQKVVEANMKKEAWEFIHKHIESFWD